MSNISKYAPYAYLAKRGGANTLYDLLVLVPVDLLRDTDLSTVNPVKSGSRVTIQYSTVSLGTAVPYRFRHWEIDNEDKYLDIEISGDGHPERTQLLAFADADTQPATVTWQMQTCAPYLFGKVEMVGTTRYLHLSCIALFDPGLGVLSENLTFSQNKLDLNLSLGTNGGVVTDPTKFAINQNIRVVLTQGILYTCESLIEGNSTFFKPPRRSKSKHLYHN